MQGFPFQTKLQSIWAQQEEMHGYVSAKIIINNQRFYGMQLPVTKPFASRGNLQNFNLLATKENPAYGSYTEAG